MNKLMNIMKIVRSILLLSLLTIISFLSFAEGRTTTSDKANLHIIEGSHHIFMQSYAGTNLPEYFSGDFRKNNRIISFSKSEEELKNNNYSTSTARTNTKVDADSLKRKKENSKERRILKMRRAEEKALTNKRRKAEDYINLLQQTDKNKRLQEADKYFENYLVKITKKRKEFINQLDANPVSILKDQPEEEILKDEAAVKIGMAKN